MLSSLLSGSDQDPEAKGPSDHEGTLHGPRKCPCADGNPFRLSELPNVPQLRGSQRNQPVKPLWVARALPQCRDPGGHKHFTLFSLCLHKKPSPPRGTRDLQPSGSQTQTCAGTPPRMLPGRVWLGRPGGAGGGWGSASLTGPHAMPFLLPEPHANSKAWNSPINQQF